MAVTGRSSKTPKLSFEPTKVLKVFKEPSTYFCPVDKIPISVLI
jgi:hypothetical protein